MKIKELNIIEFGGLCDRRYELSDGLNIFEGNNETGKSTLWLFIKFMLYGMPKKGHPERDRAISRTTHNAVGTMTVEYKNEEYRIERSFSENSRGKVTTYRVSDGEKVFVGEEPGEAMLGVPRDIFENSASIGQAACAGLGGEKGAAAIRNILSSADESVDVEKIQKKLSTLRVSLRHVNGKGGMLYDMSQSINSLESRLDKAVESHLRISELEERLSKNSKNIEAAEAAMEKARGLTDMLGKREILQRFDRLAENKKERERVAEEREALIKRESKNGYTPTAADSAGLFAVADSHDRAVSALNDAKKKVSELSAKSFSEEEKTLVNAGELILREGGAEALIERSAKAEKKKKTGVLLTVLGAVMLVASALLGILINIYIIIGAAVALAPMIIGIVMISQGASAGKSGVLGSLPKGANVEAHIKSCTAAYLARRAFETEQTEANAAELNAQRHYEYILSDMKKSLGRIAPDTPLSVENVRAEAERIRSFLDADRLLFARLEGLDGMLKADASVLSAYDENELRASIEGVEIPSMSLKQAEENKRFTGDRLRILKDKDTELRTELINLKAIGEDPVAIRDELSAQKARYAEAEKYYEAVMTAMDGIDRASALMQGNITPAIGRDAAELISSISDGRYRGVNMGRSLELELVDGRGLTTTTDMMSGGMRDAAYLALRIALMQKIFGGELPPLMMDEALCQLDGERVGRMLSIVWRLCEGGCQCLLFTCHDRERKACEEADIPANIIKLAPLYSEM